MALAGCSPTGFALDVTVTADPCIAGATLGMSVLVTPNGEGTVTQVVVAPFFGSDGTRHVVVIPRDGTNSLKVDVRVYGDAARKREIGRAAGNFPVSGHEEATGMLSFGCPFEDFAVPMDLAAPDAARDLAAPDAAHDLAVPDGARDGGVPDLRGDDLKNTDAKMKG